MSNFFSILAFVDLEIAHQLHDHFLSDVIVCGHSIADTCCRFAGIDGGVIALKSFSFWA